MKLPTREQAIEILQKNGLTPLSLDGAAHLQSEYPELWSLFEGLVATGKIDKGNLTGVAFLVGLALQTPSS
jgi:hypothetical protein